MQVVKEKTINNLPTEKHRIVAESIRVGRHNATLLSDIMSIAEIDDRRTAYQIIEDLINKYGYVIVASRSGEYKGYFYPANEMEFRKYAKTFKQSIDSMKKRYNNLINNYNK